MPDEIGIGVTDAQQNNPANSQCKRTLEAQGPTKSRSLYPVQMGPDSTRRHTLLWTDQSLTIDWPDNDGSLGRLISGNGPSVASKKRTKSVTSRSSKSISN